MCVRSYFRMWARLTREASSNHCEQETPHSEPDETFNGEKKVEKEKDRRGWDESRGRR